MTFIRKNFQNLFVAIFFIVIFFTGISIFKDYGISWDEEAKRKAGYINLNYAAQKILPDRYYKNLYQYSFSTRISNTDKQKILQKKTDELNLNNFVDKNFGPGWELFQIVIEYFLNQKDEKKIYETRHLVNFFFFLISLFFFYKLLQLKFSNFTLSILGTFVLFLTPRIFSDSFVNPIDIPFLNFFIISNYYGYKYYKKQKIKYLILFSIFCGLASSIRVIGLISIGFFSCLPLIKFKELCIKKYFQKVFLVTATPFIFYFLFTPLLWENTFTNFLSIFNYAKNINFPGHVLYLGEHYLNNQLPWHYLSVWIFTTIPLFVVLSFFASIIYIVKDFVNKKKLTENILFFFFYFLIPLGLPIIFKSQIFDGWRHFIFLYPAIIIICLTILDFFHKNFYSIYRTLIFFFLLQLIYLAHWNIKNHPNQNFYFNSIIKDPLRILEKDYWGLSNKQLLVYLSKKKLDKIYYDFYGSNLPLSIKILPKNDRKRFFNVNNIKDKSIKKYYYFVNSKGLNNHYCVNNKECQVIKKIEFKEIFINKIYFVNKEIN